MFDLVNAHRHIADWSDEVRRHFEGEDWFVEHEDRRAWSSNLGLSFKDWGMEAVRRILLSEGFTVAKFEEMYDVEADDDCGKLFERLVAFLYSILSFKYQFWLIILQVQSTTRNVDGCV